jgi:putative ABC transport system permease protein
LSIWSRIAYAFLGDRLNREIDEEFAAHIEEAIAAGDDPAEVRRAFGSQLRLREKSRDVRIVAWLDCLRADLAFGWRQLLKRKITTAAAILSLALAIGSCTSAFRLIDALLLRPLPISDPHRLYAVQLDGFTFQGKPIAWDTVSYPSFQRMREALRGQAELIGIEPAQRADLTYGSDDQMEKSQLQHVSGNMFSSFGLRPALGRLLNEDDDRVPGAKPFAVISYTYWKARFGRDPQVLGRTFRMGTDTYQIVGVSEEKFTGTEPGTIADIFVPTMMNLYGIHEPGNGWLRVFVRPGPGVAIEPVQEKMYAVYRAFEQERAKNWTNIPKELLVGYPREKLLLNPAGSGVSMTQQDFRVALMALGVLVALVLLIACANVANLMTAQAASRAREMALRVSIGAGRLRLVQMVMVESTMLALIASVLGAVFAWWAAPFVVNSIGTPSGPVRLILPADWRVLGFGLLLTLVVTLLFGLMPALRASWVKPVSALKGGDDPHARRRRMHGLIAAQVAFCFVVLFLASLFTATFKHLSDRPLGFSPDRLLLLDTVTQHPQAAARWDEMVENLKSVPGVEAVALASWPLLSGNNDNELVSINGAPPTNVLANFLSVSPQWIGTMKIPLADGRDLRPTDASPNAAIVSKEFARQFFGGQDPVGKSFATMGPGGKPNKYDIVGLVDDAAYRNVRDPWAHVAYIPLHSLDAKGAMRPIDSATIIVRTVSNNPAALASTLRQHVQQAEPAFRVSNIGTQTELIYAQTIRERLLAMLAAFFGCIALLLAGIGLYGVLAYSVLQREREFGIRIAIGAGIGSIARLLTTEVFAMVLVGALIGVALGVASVRFVATLLFGVEGSDPSMLVLPALVLFASALLSALPAVIRAARIDPSIMLRAE